MFEIFIVKCIIGENECEIAQFRKIHFEKELFERDINFLIRSFDSSFNSYDRNYVCLHIGNMNVQKYAEIFKINKFLFRLYSFSIVYMEIWICTNICNVVTKQATYRFYHFFIGHQIFKFLSEKKKINIFSSIYFYHLLNARFFYL